KNDWPTGFTSPDTELYEPHVSLAYFYFWQDPCATGSGLWMRSGCLTDNEIWNLAEQGRRSSQDSAREGDHPITLGRIRVPAECTARIGAALVEIRHGLVWTCSAP